MTTKAEPVQSHLVSSVSGVPQGVAEILPRSGAGVDQFDGQARSGKSHGRSFLPVSLGHLLTQKNNTKWKVDLSVEYRGSHG